MYMCMHVCAGVCIWGVCMCEFVCAYYVCMHEHVCICVGVHLNVSVYVVNQWSL